MATGKRKPLPFVRKEIALPPDHSWRATPGYKVLVVGRGDLRFEYPNTWVHEITDQSVKLRDKPHSTDVMLLEISVLRTPPAAQWTKIPGLPFLLADNLKKQGRLIVESDIHTVQAPALEYAWVEYRRTETDPQTGSPREAVWRHAHAHAGPYHAGPYMPLAVITFGFWTGFEDIADPVWQHFIDSMVVGQTLTDPAKGPQYQ